jgi:hypothetical protein
MPKPRKRWTAEDEAHFRSLLEAGESVMLVAAKLKRTVTATRSRAATLRISLERRDSGRIQSAAPEMEMLRIRQLIV